MSAKRRPLFLQSTIGNPNSKPDSKYEEEDANSLFSYISHGRSRFNFLWNMRVGMETANGYLAKTDK